jgi:hypothetical protein
LKTGGRGTPPNPIVLLNSLDLVALVVALHACPLESMLDRHHIVFPCHKGALPLIQSRLSYKELLPQLDDYHRCNYCIQKRNPEPVNR